jgi:hypothetical protein
MSGCVVQHEPLGQFPNDCFLDFTRSERWVFADSVFIIRLTDGWNGRNTWDDGVGTVDEK